MKRGGEDIIPNHHFNDYGSVKRFERYLNEHCG